MWVQVWVGVTHVGMGRGGCNPRMHVGHLTLQLCTSACMTITQNFFHAKKLDQHKDFSQLYCFLPACYESKAKQISAVE